MTKPPLTKLTRLGDRLAKSVLESLKTEEGKARLEEIRRRHQRRDACPGHYFERRERDQRPPDVPASTPWYCPQCDSYFHAGEVIMYRQGVAHGARGHEVPDLG